MIMDNTRFLLPMFNITLGTFKVVVSKETRGADGKTQISQVLIANRLLLSESTKIEDIIERTAYSRIVLTI